MPARKSRVAVMPHFQAVRLAPDSELKRKLVAEAEAEYRRGFGHALDESIEALTRYLGPPVQDPASFDMEMLPSFSPAQALRGSAQLARMILERDRRLEAAYQFARTLVYQTTGVRVGERFWPLELEAQQAIEQMEQAEHPADQATPAQAQPPAQEPSAEPSLPVDTPAPAKRQKPVSNKQIKSTIRRLRQAKVSPELCEALRNTAQSGQWGQEELEQAAKQLIAA
ncbi:MAG: hypothetical protein IPP14_01445 [Planctomycetes bacterium]|nr:hypothetical protein [Planctomycetota bacterium]